MFFTSLLDCLEVKMCTNGQKNYVKCMVGDFATMLRLIYKMAAGSTIVNCKHENYLLVSEETNRFMKALFCVDNFDEGILASTECIRNISGNCSGTIKKHVLSLILVCN